MQLRPLVSIRFQVLFTPLLGVLFTFPLRYLYTIGLSGVFSLSGWSRLIHTGFHVPRTTQDTAINNSLYLYRAVTVYGQAFQLVLIH